MSKTTQEMIELMQAYVNGETIEFKLKSSEDWMRVDDPSWDWIDCDYRVKAKHEFKDSDVIAVKVLHSNNNMLQVESNITTMNYHKADLEYMLSLLGEK